MNVYDSARMADVLAPLGYRSTTEVGDADLVVLNTCHIREKAAEKVYSELGRLRALKQARERSGGEMLLAVAGCVAQAEGEEVAARAPFVDIVVGPPQAYHRLAGMVAGASRARRTAVDTAMPAESRFDHLPEELAGPQPGRGVSSFLTIQEGCDRFCTFCVVPYTRGAEEVAPGRRRRGRGTPPRRRRRARDRAAGPERQRLSRRGRCGWRQRARSGGADPPAGRDRRAGAPALHHLASARHDAGADPRSRHGAQADALPAPAGAVGLRQRAGRHEPGP